MNVNCPSCETVYRVDPGKLPAGGIRARCATCGAILSIKHDPRVSDPDAAFESPAAVESPAGTEKEIPAPDRDFPEIPEPADIPSMSETPEIPSIPEPSDIPAPRLVSPEPSSAPVTPIESVPTEPEIPAIGLVPSAPSAPIAPSAPTALEPPAPEAPALEVVAPEPPAPEPPALEVVAPEPPAPEPPALEVVAPEPEPPPAAPEPSRPRRLSKPFFRPGAAPKGAPPPARPSAPVFKPAHEPPVQPVTPVPESPPAATASAQEATTKTPINPFLSRDPKQKARRLARALVSDMIVYQPKKRQDAIQSGTLKDDFEEEIKKSWHEYVGQVGKEMAKSTSYWREALNEILAGGRDIF